MFKFDFQNFQNSIFQMDQILTLPITAMKKSLLLLLLLGGSFINQKTFSQVYFFKPDSVNGVDISVWNNAPQPAILGNNFELEAYAWTNNGSPGFKRIYVNFDLSAIPVAPIVSYATLKLYNNPNSGSTSAQHSQLSGTNETVIRRVVDPWSEQTLTWLNQPFSTTQNEVLFPPSISPTQDYIIDVTALVQDMISMPGSSYGFTMKLVTEQYYRSVIFASSDHPDSTLWPELTVCLDPNCSTGGEELYGASENWKVFPRPFRDVLNIVKIAEDDGGFQTYSLQNINGQIIKSGKLVDKNTMIDTGEFPAGSYFITLQSATTYFHYKVIKH